MTKRVEFLLSQFKGSPDVLDPAIYVASLASILADYPEEVAMKATDPRSGISRYQNWHPTTHELDRFCGRLAEPIRREAERNARITDRARLLAAPEPAPRKSFAELQAACKLRGGMVPSGSSDWWPRTDEDRAVAVAELEALRERAKQPSGVKASDELLAKLQEER